MNHRMNKCLFFCAVSLLSLNLSKAETAKLIRHFNFDEGFLESVYSNEPSEIVGSPTLIDGISGQAVRLDGQSALIYDDYFDLNVTTYTLTAWVNPDLQEQRALIVNRGTNNYWILFNQGEVRSGFYDKDRQEIYSATYLQPGTWYFIAVTYDGQAIRMYIDQHLHWMKKVEGRPRQIEEPFVIGAQPANKEIGNFFRGTIDEVRLYDGALSQAEVFELFKQFQPQFD